MTVKTRHLAVGAALTVVAGAALAVLAWWLLRDGSAFWTIVTVRGIVAVVLSKVGLKAGLAGVLGAVALAAWLRRRRATPEAEAGVPVGVERE